MRLIDPAPGELMDRLVILHLKIIHGQQLGKSIDHFDAEAEEIVNKLREWTLRLDYVDDFLRLMAINAVLWEATDQMERLAKSMAHYDHTDAAFHEAGVVGIHIYRLNTQRAELVSKINQWMGRLQDQPKEKL